jgi:putative MATE family efflux protein
MGRERDLTAGPIAGHVRALAIPTALSLLFLTLYNVTDTLFAGQISTEAQAGLGLGGQLFFAVAALGIGFRIGAASVVGQLIGKGDLEEARKASAQTMLLAVVATVAAMAAAPFVLEPLIDVVAQGRPYGDAAHSYVHILLFATPGYIVAYSLSGIQQAVGDAQTLARAQAVATFTNVGLNPLFVWGIPGVWGGLGLDGIALATVCCQTGVLAYMAFVAWGSTPFAGFHLGRLQPDAALLLDLGQQIVPGSLRLLVIAVGGFIAQIWLRDGGDAAVAAYNVGLRLEQLLLLPAIGITAALLPFTSQNMGAGKPERVRDGFWSSTAYATALLVGGTAFVWTLGPTVVGWFGAGSEAEAHALDYLRVESLVFPLFAPLFGLQNLLQGVKRPLWPLAVGVWRQGIAVAVFGYLYVRVLDMGPYGVWLTVASGVVTGTLLIGAVSLQQLPKAGLDLRPAWLGGPPPSKETP